MGVDDLERRKVAVTEQAGFDKQIVEWMWLDKKSINDRQLNKRE